VRIAFASVLSLTLLLPLVAVRADTSTGGAPPTARPLDLDKAPAQDARFKRWVKRRGGRLSRWGWAQLDDDDAPERFAYVCKSDEYDSGAWLLVEDDDGKRWSIDYMTDGRNGCEIHDDARWERDAPTALELSFRYHGGWDSAAFALRGGRLVAVRTTSSVQHFHGEEDCSTDEQDLDAREARHTACVLDKKAASSTSLPCAPRSSPSTAGAAGATAACSPARAATSPDSTCR